MGANQTILTIARQRLMTQMPQRLEWSDENVLSYSAQNKRLWGMVQKYTGHPLLLDFLSSLIESYQVPARDAHALVEAIRSYSANHIKFFRERPERFQSPMRTVAWGFGDCDDKAIFVATSVRSFRIPVHLKILRLQFKEVLEDGQWVSVRPGEPVPASYPVRNKQVGHVYPEAWIDGAWLPLESVRPFPIGHDPALRAAERGLLVKTEIIGDNPESGAYA